MSATQTKSPASTAVADQVADFIGRTMGDLLQRKNVLAKQMADIDQQIAEVRQRVVHQFGSYLPGDTRSRRGTSLRGRQNGSTRIVSDETRIKMAAAARKRWARERAKKARAGKPTRAAR